MKATFTLLLSTITLLGGCAQMADSMRRVEADRVEFARRCATMGGVIYDNRCMSPQDARAAQHRAFVADQAERDRQAMLQAACISRGGNWLQQLNSGVCLNPLGR